MKVAILHHDLEPSEKKIKEFLIEKKLYVELIDIRKVKLTNFQDFDLVLNRVYASVANRDFPSIIKTLELLMASSHN